MSYRTYFEGNGRSIESLDGVSGESAFLRSLGVAPRSGHLGDFIFGYLDENKETSLDFGFPSAIYPSLGKVVVVNFVDVREEEVDEGAGWAIRSGDSDRRFEVQEGLYAYERNFVKEAVAIQALDYFLKTGDRNLELNWEPFKFFSPGWEEFYVDNGRG